MIARLKKHLGKLPVATAALVLCLSGGWTWRHQAAVRRVRAQSVATPLTGAAYEAANLPAPDLAAAVWAGAPAQAHGHGWLYEVFTPPVIYYHTVSHSFAVIAPGLAADAGLDFGIALLDVKREQYRLQLVGYIGGAGDYQAAFVCPGQPGTFLVREGRHLAELGLTLKSFAVKKVPVEHGDPWPVYDIAAQAVVTEDRTGTDVVLDSRSRKFTDTPLAVLRTSRDEGQLCELHEGEVFSDERSDYRIEHIQLDPPQVVVARCGPGLARLETKVLRPTLAGKPDDPPADGVSLPLPDRPPTGLAANRQ